MLDNTFIVQSAVSAFNNAALWAPAFFWSGLLALPLFVVAFLCADSIVKCVGWNRENIQERVSVWVAGLIFLWVVLFGGNYSVLRDNLSVLPMMTAVIVFLTSLFVSSHLRKKCALPRLRWRGVFAGIVVMAAVGLSDLHAWWGPLLQVGSMLLGGILGWFARGVMRPVAGIVLIMTVVTVAMLMQPEFFRFGQLGNLTLIHLGVILLFAVAVAATIILTNFKPRKTIKNSVFVKLKWLARVICALGGALFLLTEAVPLFLATLVVLGVSFALSVLYSGKNIDGALGEKMFACAIGVFGVLTFMPVITVLAILYWKNTRRVDFLSEIRHLL